MAPDNLCKFVTFREFYIHLNNVSTLSLEIF